MRLFLAIPLDRETRRAVVEVQEQFRRQRVRGNYSRPENLHITLAFIGEYPDPEAVLEATERVAFASFSIAMDQVGCFGDLWWTGFSESRELERLAKDLRDALAGAGIPYDRKKFKAHVTFLRRPEYGAGQPVAELPAVSRPMPVTGVALMQSTRGKSGMIYTELGRVEAERFD